MTGEKQDLQQKIAIIKSRSQDVCYYYLSPYYQKKAFKPGTTINCPWRDDKHPSFNVYLKNGEMHYKDFAGNGGDCIQLVQDLMGLKSPGDAIGQILHDLNINESSKPVYQEPLSDYSIDIKNYSEFEIKYWAEYGISTEFLSENKIHSLSGCEFTTKTGKTNIAKATESNPIFAYIFPGAVKLYRPFNKDSGAIRFLWLGKKPEQYLFHYDKLPPSGEMCFITAGEKDALSLRVRGFYATCENSETANINDDIAADLKKRFKYVIVVYDNDKTGLESGKKIAEKHDFLNLILPPIENGKDVSDFFKSGKHEADFYDLADRLIKEQKNRFFAGLGKNVFNASINYIEPQAIVSIQGETVATAGNIITLLGQIKSGKSGICGAILAGAIKPPGLPIDALGITILANSSQKAVLHFDTEQSEGDFIKFNHRVLRRAGRSSQPEYYISIALRQYDHKKRIQIIEEAFQVTSEAFKGIHLAIIDQIGDLLPDANEAKDSTILMERLMALTEKFKTPIFVTIHKNPGAPGADAKGRGHLGTFLGHKSESIISIDNEDGISRLEPVRMRNASASELPVLLFKWDKEKGYHTSFGELQTKKEKSTEELKDMALQIFRKPGVSLTHKAIKSMLMEGTSCSEKTARSYIEKMTDMGHIKKGDGKFGTYELGFFSELTIDIPF